MSEHTIVNGVVYDYDEERDEPVSNCCGARIIFSDICSECKEHCEPTEEGGQ